MRIALLLVAGCIRTAAVTCADGQLCAPDRVCDDIHLTCVYPDQLKTCVGLADGTACTINQAPGGICKDMVCIPATCGDGLVSGDERCDGANSIPTVGTCVDFAYDYGPLSCSPPVCTAARWPRRQVSSCRSTRSRATASPRPFELSTGHPR